jgi:hypothetical protein
MEVDRYTPDMIRLLFTFGTPWDAGRLIMKPLSFLATGRSTGWMMGAIALALMGTGCTPEAPVADEPLPDLPLISIDENAADANIEDTAIAPAVEADGTATPAAIPNLIPPTTSEGQLARIQSGRNNPFAPLESQPVAIARTTPPAPAPTPTAVPAPATLPPPQPISVVPIDSTPMPVVQPGEPTLTDAIAAAPGTPATPTARLADLIEITGVVEVGGQVSVILRAPNEHTSRYVRVGDYLANGQVLVKRVDMQAGGEPLVILEQDGVEIPRYVGSGAA